MKHLDDEALRLLDAGDAATREYFAVHLSSPCDECEIFLANTEGPGLLDAAADAALTVRSADMSASLDEIGYRRLRRALERSHPSPTRTRWRLRVIAIGSVAAGLVALVTVMTSRPISKDTAVEPMQRAKGQAEALTLALYAAHQSSAGSLQRVDPGTVVPAAGALVFRYEASERGSAWLLARHGDRLDALGAFDVYPGVHPLTMQSGEIASLPLADEAGRLTLFLVGAAGRSPSLDEARQAIENPSRSPLATAHLEVRIGEARR